MASQNDHTSSLVETFPSPIENTENHHHLSIVSINNSNLNIYKNLAQAYEAEFSPLTQKYPNELGIFEPDTLPQGSYTGHLLYYKKTPIGFCVTNLENEVKDISEFYIIPNMRKRNFGQFLAMTTFDKYPGKWQVRQIEGAFGAIKFWRKVIEKYINGNYHESVVDDTHWGKVTRQTFNTQSFFPHESWINSKN